jgi:predicted dehydrogenase
MIDSGVRPIRALRLIFGEPDSVFAARGPQVHASMEGEDSAQLLFFSQAGWQAHVLLGWTARRGDLPEYIVICEKASLHLWMNRGSMVVYPTEPLPVQRLMSKVRPHWLQEKLMSPRLEGRRVRLPGNDRTGHIGQMREFLRAVASGSAETGSALEARRDLETIFRAYDSMNSGRLLPLETREPVAV